MDRKISYNERLTAAADAMRRFDFTIADAIFAEAEALEGDALKRAADAAYARGLIAEQDARMTDAAAHFARASQLRLAAMSPDERAAHDAANGPKGE
jgi:hypothetical protein